MNDESRKRIMKFAIKLMEEGREYTIPKIVHLLQVMFDHVPRKNIEFAVRNALKMHYSFRDAVDQAGGAGWDFSELKDMTYLDLLNSLATNGVRFHFEKKKK